MPETCNFVYKRLWHKCFPVNFAKVLSTPRLKNTSGQLILSYWPNIANSITNSLRKFCVSLFLSLFHCLKKAKALSWLLISLLIIGYKYLMTFVHESNGRFSLVEFTRGRQKIFINRSTEHPSSYKMFCAIWWHLCNLKNMKSTHGGMLLLKNLLAEAEAWNLTNSNTPPWVFFTFFKLYKWYRIMQSIYIILINFLKNLPE